ncbi:uncharacterized protein LOC143622136 [Bidens hawaiensis]|uniref:uncharacterized protein LOC143622136 n=1 Tax=Bidens hawaiensis TaxID=980011 RepID=UPI004049CBB7
MDKKRRLLRKWKYFECFVSNLSEYEICRSGENRAEVKHTDQSWEVSLDERTCTCRRWQVKGIPCPHAAAFMIFTRDANWEIYVYSYFTIEECKLAYALEIAPMPTKDQWVYIDTDEKIYPLTIKLPPGRPRKNIIKLNDETKKRQKCKRCGE